MSISRRDALMGATAAAITTGAITAPLAIKAAGAKAALAGDPVLPAFEAFEAARLAYVASEDRLKAAHEAIKAAMPPKPHGQTDLSTWDRAFTERTETLLGGDEDDISEAYHAPVRAAYGALMVIEATTVTGLLQQIHAWSMMYHDLCDSEVPWVAPEDRRVLEGDFVLVRVYHDIERLAGGPGHEPVS